MLENGDGRKMDGLRVSALNSRSADTEAKVTYKLTIVKIFNRDPCELVPA